MKSESSLPEIVLEDIPIRVNGYDIDFAGIVSNIVYIRWLEDIRTRWCDRFSPLSQMFAEGYCPIVLQTKIDYRVALRMGDIPTGQIAMTLDGRLRWKAQFLISVNGKAAAEAEQMGVFIRLSDSKPLPIPAAFRALFTSTENTAIEVN